MTDSQRASWCPSPTSWGATPALGLSGLALVALGGFAALVLPPLLSPQPAAAGETQVVEQVGTRLPDPSDPPALQVVRAVLGDRADFGQVVPASFGCAVPQTVISATASAPEGQVGLFVLPTGYGGTWTDTMGRCGRSTEMVPGASAVRMQVDGGQVLAWNRGDVLVTLAAGSVTAEAAGAVDARVIAALTPVCANLAPAAGDATRNPRHDAFAQWTVAADVTIEPSGLAPVDISMVPALAQAPAMTMPRGVSGPPAPVAVSRPGELGDPGSEVLTTSVSVPALDVTGPGCGWSFTAAAAPRADAEQIAAQGEQVRSSARADLLRGQASWITARAELEAALPAHLEAVEAWNGYVTQATDVRAAWDAQARELADYEADRQVWQQQVVDQQAWLTRRAEAQAAYDEQLRVCAESPVEITLGAKPATGTSPAAQASAATCPPVRPAVLDEAEQVVGPEPVAPSLWTP